MADKDAIALSVVVRVVGGDAFLRRCLDHLVKQTGGRAMEVIVPYDSLVRGVAGLERDFPQVRFVDMGVIGTDGRPVPPGEAHLLYDRRTAKGLAVARGEILALLEDYGAPGPDWCTQVLDAHLLPYGVIGGAVEQEADGTLNWAVYFLDFGRYQLPLREGPVAYLSDVNVSYKRPILESVRSLWEEKYNEVTVHWALARQGAVLWQRPQIVVRQDRGRLALPSLIVERFAWGRLFASRRVQEVAVATRVKYAVLSPLIPVILLARIAQKVFRSRRHRAKFLRSFPVLIVLALSWCLGEFVGYVSGREHIHKD
ncbi:MAG: hypothetical protein IT330_16520 [Anaerolineae bacterium]|nr:hypothetical protein [Anaerolineae bacterium]